MPYYQVFSKKLTKSNVNSLAGEQLTYTKYLLAIAAPRNELFSAVTIQRRLDNNQPFTVVASNLGSENGQAIVELGYLIPGEKVDIFWIVSAVSKVSAVAVYLINDQTKELQKIAPKDGTKSIERAGRWADEVVDLALF